MKKFLFLAFVLLGVTTLTGFWWYENVKPQTTTAAYKNFLITKGLGASQIGNKLEKEGLIKNALTFKFYVQLTGLAKRIQAGEYQLATNLSLYKLVNLLLHGPTEEWVTIPEGLRKEEVIQRFIDVLEPEDRIIFEEEFLSLSANKEGYLFPETYLFPRTASPAGVMKKMLATFDKKVEDISQDQLILASLVERETKTEAERPIVAGILLTRLEIGMPLQVDATIQYIKGKAGNWWPATTILDRQVKSAFNTYLNRGLPPAPICNPGLSSIKAVIYPEESDYLYYLHDAKGQIYYAVSLEEHNSNIKKYLGD